MPHKSPFRVAALPLILALGGGTWGTDRVGPIEVRPAEAAAVGPQLPAAISGRRVLVVVPAAERARNDLRVLESNGGTFEQLRKRGWSIGAERGSTVRIVDRSQPTPEDLVAVLARIPESEGVTVVGLEQGEIVRSFKRGCTTPLDSWTFGWLLTGNDERPVEPAPEPVQVATTGNYRLRGNHWSVEGVWNPTREYVLSHLRAAHSGSLQAGWDIQSWSLEELRSLHDDIHDREEGFRGRYSATAAARSSRSGGGGIGKPGSR